MVTDWLGLGTHANVVKGTATIVAMVQINQR